MIYKKQYATKFYEDLVNKYGYFISLFMLGKLVIFFLVRNLKWIFYLIFNKKSIIIGISKSKIILPMKDAGFDLTESTITKQLALSKIREVESTKILQKIVKPGDLIIELGANIGYFMILEAEKMEVQGKIIAIEPEPNNIEYLKKNIALNNLHNLVEIHEMAISDHDGYTKLNISREANCHTIFNPENKQVTRSIKVKTKTLDSFLKKRNYKADLIRMDIEGAECLAIKGMTKTLSTNKNLKLFIEIHPHLFKKKPNPIIALLKELKKYGFDTTHVISYDKYYRRLVEMEKTEKICINDLIKDQRTIEGKIGFQVFFERK